MPRVKFLRDTVHPDYGEVKKGEVLSVPRAYADEYDILDIAEEVEDEDVSRPEPRNASQKALEPPGRRRRAALRAASAQED